jgi:hypothetical protein
MEQGSALLTKTSQTAHGVAASDCAGFVEASERFAREAKRRPGDDRLKDDQR